MNKSDLVSAVREQLGVSASRAKTLVDAVLEEVERAVGRGQKVTLSGLGVFEQVVEGAAKVPVFRPAKSLTDAALRRVRETVGEPGDGPRSSATRTPPESSTEQKPTATRTTEKKTAAKKATTTKSGGTRPTAAKTAASTSTAAKTAGTKAAAKKTAAKKTTAKKTTAKKTAARRGGPPAATTAAGQPTVGEVVPPPLPDPTADALAAAGAELARPVPDVEPEPLVPPLAEPEADEDTVVYTSETEDEPTEP